MRRRHPTPNESHDGNKGVGATVRGVEGNDKQAKCEADQAASDQVANEVYCKRCSKCDILHSTY